MTLIIDNVTKRFGKFTAVDQLSLTIPKHEIFGFLGGNGAGKTTTFRMVLGLIDQTEGTITWENSPINYDSSHLIGYLPEERGLYPKLTVKNQITYLARLRGMAKPDILSELERWLDRFNVPEYLNKKVEELSKGNQQKIQFISAVIHKPELLILDEPFSGLDPINVEMMKEAVLDLKEAGTTIVFSSHQMADVEDLCEHLCILQKGKPVVEGELREIKRSYGKKNLRIHADTSLEFLKDFPGVVQYRRISDGCELQIENENVSQEIFQALQDVGFIRRFELEEPSLNDIFIEKVGASYE
jgi:ABC-2 type transport system ATP-binding protein